MAGSAKRQRNCQVVVRCTPDELAAIDSRADLAGVARGAFLRAAGLGDSGPRAQKRPPSDQLILRRVLGELGRVGNNINQIARALNRERQVEIPELRAALGAYLEIRDAIFKALGMTTSRDEDDHQRRKPGRP